MHDSWSSNGHLRFRHLAERGGKEERPWILRKIGELGLRSPDMDECMQSPWDKAVWCIIVIMVHSRNVSDLLQKCDNCQMSFLPFYAKHVIQNVLCDFWLYLFFLRIIVHTGYPLPIKSHKQNLNVYHTCNACLSWSYTVQMKLYCWQCNNSRQRNGTNFFLSLLQSNCLWTLGENKHRKSVCTTQLFC